MTSAEVYNQIREMAADLFQAPAAGITADSSPLTLERWDSVQHLNLVLELEQRFGVRFEPEEMDAMTTVGLIAALVESKVRASGRWGP